MGCPAAKRCYTHTWYGTFHGTNESDNGKMNQIVGIFRSIAQSENCAVEIEQHTRKPAAGVQGDYTGHDGRGAALRAQRVLNHMSKEDAAAHGIPSMTGHFRLVSVCGVGVMEGWSYCGSGTEDAGRNAAADDMFMHLLAKFTNKKNRRVSIYRAKTTLRRFLRTSQKRPGRRSARSNSKAQ